MAHSNRRVVHVLAIALVLCGAVVAVVRIDSSGPADSAPLAGTPISPRPVLKQPKPAQPGGSQGGGLGHSSLVVSDERGGTGLGSAGPTSSRFRDLFRAQYRATVDPYVPATNYWALLIGINEYSGRTRDNIGSYQDARELRRHLLSLGWRSDHILLLGNRHATASNIIQSIRWLASKTDSSSVVVFNYSGHEMPTRSTADGDRESRDIAIQASDNRLVLDGVLGREMGRVAAEKMWINLAVCRAGGFDDPGMVRPGRVITYSSPESELSYEDPSVHHSVFGWYEIMDGMVQKQADANGNGDVTVEEAFRYARPYVINRTSSKQHPFIVDNLSGSMSLRPPKPVAQPAPAPAPSSGGDDDGCVLVICGSAATKPD